METMDKTTITVESNVAAPIEKVWKFWTTPEHITHWNNASPDWHTPRADNDLQAGGKFVYRMEAKDGSFGFDYGGTYDKVIPNELLHFTLGDGRRVSVAFHGNDKETKIIETFEAEGVNSIELQRGGWQAILDNFKKYTEAN